MLTVLVVLSLIAASSVPALHAIDQARQAAAANEIERLLIGARARAMASARPTGLSVQKGSILGMVEVLSDNATPTTAGDVFDEPFAPIDLPASYAAATIAKFINGDGSAGTGIVWFNHRGEPHTRKSSGVYTAAFTQDAVFTLSTGSLVRVHMLSGAVDQE